MCSHVCYKLTCLTKSVVLIVFLNINTEALLIASKEIGLEVNAEKTKYMVMSQDQNAVQNGYIQIGNKLFELRNSLNIWEQP
jgi:hypothetical protein